MSGARKQKEVELDSLSDNEILQMRVRDLNLQIEGSELKPLIERLYRELDEKEIHFHPTCYLADEWLCPEKVPIIGIPFYLVHPRLKNIEKKMMLEVEGEPEQLCMKFLRHECGHALNYAYQFYKRTRWRQLFGPFSQKYSASYYFRPYSRRYVVNLNGNYAQAHPDEDFAETFAVWLCPSSNWQNKYKDWPVIKKLRYADQLMRKVSGTAPKDTPRAKPPWSASRMTSTLAAYYERKRKVLGSEFQGFYDDSLKRAFAAKSKSGLKASKLLRLHRQELVNNVTTWTSHRKYDIYQLVNKLIARSDKLGLYACNDDIVAAASLLTAIAGNTLRNQERHKPR